MLFVGDDWAEDHHDIEIVDEDGRRLAQRRLPGGLVLPHHVRRAHCDRHAAGHHAPIVGPGRNLEAPQLSR